MSVLLLVAAAAAAAQTDRTPLHRALQDPPGSIRAEESLAGAVGAVAQLWPRASAEIATQLGVSDPAPVEVVLLSERTFSGWARAGFLPEWGVGFASWPGGPIVLNVEAIARGRKSLDEVLRHELSHVYLGQRLGGAGVPRWFVEGVAQWQSGEWRLLDSFAMVRAAGTQDLRPLSQLSRAFPAGGHAAGLAYQISMRAVSELEKQLQEKGGWRAVVDRAAETGRFDTAFREVTGVSMQQFATEFDKSVRVRYGWIAAVGSAGSLFTAMTFLFLLGAARAYWRKHRRLAQMEEEEKLLFFEP